jgi:hypothetical protein
VISKLDIHDLPDRLEYHVTQRHTRSHLVLRTSAWTMALFVVLRTIPESPVFAIFAAGFLIFVSATDITRARRGTEVTLIVTERDIISNGYTQDEYRPINRWRIQAPDLCWQESRSYDDGPVYPQGVYCGGDCVLPLVTMEEGHRIVEQVYTRFPDTASESRYDDFPVLSPIITLGLSRD